MSVRKEACIPGGKSGFCCRGVIGPLTDEILCFLQAFLNEISVGLMSGC